MKEKLKKLIEQSILSWTDVDIYVISLLVYDDHDNPCKPTVTLGYNTEQWYRDSIPEADDAQEARWNYAFWIQNEELCYGIDDTASDVKRWVLANGFPYNENDDELEEEEYDRLVGTITKAFVRVLIEIVQQLHTSGIIKNKFGKEIPVLIHELEYYDEIAEQNIEANGEELVKDFVDVCTGED